MSDYRLIRYSPSDAEGAIQDTGMQADRRAHSSVSKRFHYLPSTVPSKMAYEGGCAGHRGRCRMLLTNFTFTRARIELPRFKRHHLGVGGGWGRAWDVVPY